MAELERRSIVTRLGEGVDATGALGEPRGSACSRVLGRLRERDRRHGARRTTAVMTSAVRDAANGAAFARGYASASASTRASSSGDAEARLTYLGATTAATRRRVAGCW